jgi:hypothetical protein
MEKENLENYEKLPKTQSHGKYRAFLTNLRKTGSNPNFIIFLCSTD